jgi:hypothetical protein
LSETWGWRELSKREATGSEVEAEVEEPNKRGATRLEAEVGLSKREVMRLDAEEPSKRGCDKVGGGGGGGAE